MSIFGKRKLNILVLGADGMLGYDVYEHFKKQSTLEDSNVGTVTGITLADGFDFTVRHELGAFMTNKIHYDWCINCIAYTDTWKAEHDSEGKLMSYKLNALAPKYIAESCNFHKTKLIHISTDYVFSEMSYSLFTGIKADIFNEPFPKNNYGMHKLLGEKEIAESFNLRRKNYAILRTSWLYGAHNSKSFVHKFMKNVGKACKEANNEESAEVIVDMTSDEHSIPTSTACVIDCIDDVIKYSKYGIMHAVPFSAISETPPSRLDFAKEILANYKYGEELFGRKISDVVLNGTSLPPAALQPTRSSMMSSFSDVASWQWYIYKFMRKHGKEILEFAIKENEK